MKRFLLLLIGCLMIFTAKSQYVSLSDSEMGIFLQQRFPSCFNGLGQLDTTCSSIITLDTLRVDGNPAIASLDDLKYFDQLKYLEVGFTNLVSVQQLPNTLETLIFDDPLSQLSSFTLPPNLKKFVLRGCENMSYVPPAWPSTLQYLDLTGCAYTSITNLPSSLDTLKISGQVNINGLTVPAGNTYPSLISLALPANLRYLDCSRNGLTTLNDIPNSLTWLDCSQQYSVVDDPVTFAYKQIPKLQQIDHLSPQLEELYCYSNALTSLPALPPTLRVLSAFYNKYNISFAYFDGSSVSFSNPGIATVPDFPSTLTTIRLNINNISCLPYIPASVTNFYINQNPLNCLPNSLPGGLVNTDAAAIPLCNAINNSYQCERHPILAGTLFYDNNLNGTQDLGELPRANVRVQLETGLSTFTNNNGQYEISADIGAHTLTIEAPPFYQAVPAFVQHNITLPGEYITDLIPLQRTQLVDSMRLSVVNTTETRPGFPMTYRVTYENVGTTTVTPAFVFDYDETKLTYNSSSNAAVVNNGQELQLAMSGLQPGQQGSFTVQFTVNVSNTLGSVIRSIGTITAGSSVATDSIETTVIGSFDPNDKQATATLTRLQVDGGNYINYLIRFQNTGSASAIRIVLADTLNTTWLKAETVQLLDASHTSTVTQNGNKLFFDFKNIFLPASSVDEPGSHGFVRFRVKPVTGLPDNTTATNRASIYFDFNASVGTGDAQTILNLAPVPVALSLFNVKKQAEQVRINWATAQETNSAYFIVERSDDQRRWTAIRRIAAAGSSQVPLAYETMDAQPLKGINYYRLKPVDLDGTFSYSETKSVLFGSNATVVVAPNPAKTIAQVIWPVHQGWFSVSVLDAQGKEINCYKQTGSSMRLSLNGYTPGIYFLIIQSGDQKEIRKLIVQ